MNKTTTKLKGLVAFAAFTATCNMNAEQPQLKAPTVTSKAKETKPASDNVVPHSSSEVHKSKSAATEVETSAAAMEDNYATSFLFVGKVTGIVCSACVRNVRTAIERVPGVSHVNIRPDASGGPAEIEITASRANLSKDDITRSLGGSKRIYDVPEFQVSKVEIKPISKKS